MAAIASITNGEAMSSVRTKLNSVITEINILDPTDWIDYSATSTIVGWSSFTTKQIRYKIIGKQMFIQCNIDGISNSINASFTIPNNSINISEVVTVNRNSNNGVASSTFGMTRVLINQNIVTSFINNAGGTWTSSGSKFIECQFFIEIA